MPDPTMPSLKPTEKARRLGPLRSYWDWLCWWWSAEERKVRGVLRLVARQRVSMLDWNEEGAVYIDDEVGPDLCLPLLTCHLRGWVEAAEHFAMGRIEFDDGSISVKPWAVVAGFPVPDWYPAAWRLTEAGWAIINWAQPLVFLSFATGLLGLTVALIAL